MFASASDLLPRLLPDVPGCPDEFAIFTLRDSMREVFRATQIWQFDLPAIDIVSGQRQYPLVTGLADPQPEVCRIEWVKISKVAVNPSRFVGPMSDPSQYTLVGITNSPFFALQFDPQYTPQSSVTGGLNIRVRLVPAPDADNPPAFYLGKVFQAIVSHAAWKLNEMPGRKWSNAARSTLLRRRYMRDLSDLKYLDITQGLPASPRGYGDQYIGIRDQSP